MNGILWNNVIWTLFNKLFVKVKYIFLKKKKTLNKIKLEVWFTLADRIHSEMPSRTARQY